VAKASFIIRLADVDRGVRDYEWDLPVEWLKHAFADTDAVPEGPGRVKMTASKSGSQVILHGRAEAHVTMPCARTLEPVPVRLDSDIVLMLRPSPSPAPATKPGVVQSSKNSVRAYHESRRAQRSDGVAHHKTAHDPESELTLEDASEDFYHGEQIELDPFIREFLVLELPMMPLRSDLRFEVRPAIPATPESTVGEDANFIDPRLRPLADLASRLKKTTKE
jgi:uncharacterized protein